MQDKQRGKDLATAIKGMDTSFVYCRRYRHGWEPWQAEALPRKAGFIEAIRCWRCGTERHEVLDRYGDQTKHPRYVYPDGYLMKGVGRLMASDRGQLRIASIMDRIAKDRAHA